MMLGVCSGTCNAEIYKSKPRGEEWKHVAGGSTTCPTKKSPDGAPIKPRIRSTVVVTVHKCNELVVTDDGAATGRHLCSDSRHCNDG